MAKLSLGDTIGRVASSNLTERSKALSDLKAILEYNQSNGKLQTLDKDALQHFFEQLFAAATTEKKTYVKTWRSSSKGADAAASRLAKCAQVLLLATKIVVQQMRLKLVRTLLEHIMQTLPMGGGDFCEPLSLDYMRSMRTVLEYQPHVEHLSRNIWESVAEFCLQFLDSLHRADADTDDVPPASAKSHEATPEPFSGRTSRSGLGDSLDQSRKPKDSTASANSALSRRQGELFLCLRQLTQAPNAPVLDHAESIVSVLISALHSLPGSNPSQQDAFAAINNVLKVIMLHSIRLTQHFLSQLIPIIKNSWITKQVFSRDELLITLVLGMPHIKQMMKAPENEDFREHTVRLLETVQREYFKRFEKDQLQVEELEMRRASDVDGSTFLKLPTFCLTPDNARSETNWTILMILGRLYVVLDGLNERKATASDESPKGRPSKRLRASDNTSDLLRSLNDPSAASRVAALQVLTFMAAQPGFYGDLEDILERLTSLLSETKGSIATWSMLAMTFLVLKGESADPKLASRWLTVWQLASRSVTQIATTRVACHLLDVLLHSNLVPYTAISGSIDSIFGSVDLHGPTLATESALAFLANLLKRRTMESPAAFRASSEIILHWLFSKWSPGSFGERSIHMTSAHHCDLQDVLRLVSICADRPNPAVAPRPLVPCYAVAQAWEYIDQQAENLYYLLQLDAIEDAFPQTTCTNITRNVAAHQGLASAEAKLADFCLSEYDKAKEAWRAWTIERPLSITANMIQILAIFATVIKHISSWEGSLSANKRSALSNASSSLIKAITNFAGRQDCEQTTIDPLVNVAVQSLPPVERAGLLGLDAMGLGWNSMLISELANALEDRRCNSHSHNKEPAYNLMDVDEDFESPASNGVAAKHDHQDLPNGDIAFHSSMNAMRAAAATYIVYAASLVEASSSVAGSSAVPSIFIEHLGSMAVRDVLACRNLLKSVLHAPGRIATDDAETILDYMATNILEDYEHKQCEVAVSLVVDVLNTSAPLWTDPAHGSLHELGTQMYGFFNENQVNDGILSTSVVKSIADMHLHLLKIDRDPGQGQDGLKSARTALLELLNLGDIQVKFHVATTIADIFSLYTLSKHKKIFKDVYKCLPKDPGWPEGLALGLLLLSRLASKWSTLLRHCVYHIFETAGQVRATSVYATYCIASISSKLELQSPAEIFELFAPQLLNTWLGSSRSIKEVPFNIFGFQSLRELLEAVEEEVHAQLFMFGKRDEIAFVAELLHTDSGSLLRRSIPRTATYGFLWDTLSKGKVDASSRREAQLQSLQGNERYYEAVRSSFPAMLGVCMTTLDLSTPKTEKEEEKEEEESLTDERAAKVEEQAAKTAFEYAAKHAYETKEDTTGNVEKGYIAAAFRLDEIMVIGASKVPTPAKQPPSYGAKNILDVMGRTCRRAGFELTSCWTPELFTHVLRCLFNEIHPALGSLHSCSVIRRVRFLLALAGDVAFSGYTLQVLLQTLRPFLTQAQCAEDTIGIFQYLLGHSKPFLATDTMFLTGSALSILISLRLFLGGPQESTTQESQRRATVSRMQSFHTWLASYLKGLMQQSKVNGHSDREHAGPAEFSPVLAAALELRSEGNAFRGTPESKLLLELLLEGQGGRPALEQSTKELALSLLCHNFLAPTTIRDDFITDDATATNLAVSVWKSCQQGGRGANYLLWSAKVLGRAYRSSGEVNHQFLRPAHKPAAGDVPSREDAETSSRFLILSNLLGLLRMENSREAGLAEKTLGTIFASLSEDELRDTEAIVGPDTMAALSSSRLDELDLARTRSIPPSHDFGPTGQDLDVDIWTKNLSIHLAKAASDDPVVGALPYILDRVDGLAKKLLPYVLHAALLLEVDSQRTIREDLSQVCNSWFKTDVDSASEYKKILLKAVLHLRTQPIPRENSTADRAHWLELNYIQAAWAAVVCGMHSCALLLAEIPTLQNIKLSRRSSVSAGTKFPTELQLAIYKNLDEPDAFYGVEQTPSLSAVLEKLDYEAEGAKSLYFRSARLDSEMRRSSQRYADDACGVVSSLTRLNLNSLTHAMLSSEQLRDSTGDNVTSMMTTARRLEQWDIRAPEVTTNDAVVLFRTLQGIRIAADQDVIRSQIGDGFLDVFRNMLSSDMRLAAAQSSLQNLAILTQMDEVFGCSSVDEMNDVWENMSERDKWMKSAQLEDFYPLLSTRETIYSILSQTSRLQNTLHAGPKDVRTFEVKALLKSSEICRQHRALQESLASATYLSGLVGPCKEMGLPIDAPAQFEIACVLWEQGETTAAIRMLEEIDAPSYAEDDSGSFIKSKLLVKLGQYTAEARLQKPDEIVRDLLRPAIIELGGETSGDAAGQAFYAFAAFCDQQLQDPAATEDLIRMQKLTERRQAEVTEFTEAAQNAKSSKERDANKSSARKAKKWLELDRKEFLKLRQDRDNFVRQALEYYLLALHAYEDNDNVVLRIFALWLEHADSAPVNAAVGKHLSRVPSRKFAILMNQLGSRLQADKTDFQDLLYDLIFRICNDHPYHGMYQIFAGQQSVSSKDESARSRMMAAREIAKRLHSDKHATSLWTRLSQANNIYHDVCVMKFENMQSGKDYSMERFSPTKKMQQGVPSLKVPPATAAIELRNDCDYGNVPVTVKIDRKLSIANGLSAPKIIKFIGSDGRPYKQLFKSGNDDLRQDAIMEQVFEQVSQLLKNHTATRRRNLHIRTYKVLPLSSRTGIIEFVQNTIPLHNFLMPAHAKYHPKDWKINHCRDEIHRAGDQNAESRIKVFRKVCENFAPVGRYFFLERFLDPDEWFARRLAYTRSTAAISMLGHVLGLGDRHCHNILLDEKTGEVVHIDLGVAFEAGRVLPIPEVVPFRLTRDLVDAMGSQKTEGVFRRCCEFTLETLREERSSIMTLLNVLRYDPLVNWTVQKDRARRIQEQQQQQEMAATNATAAGGETGANVQQAAAAMPPPLESRKDDQEAGEAGRALSVVEKKLSKALSVQATVSELITTATDERNLALLYSGWAAYA